MTGRKHSMFKSDGSLVQVEGKLSICNIHLTIARRLVERGHRDKDMLDLLDIAYDMGKRMNTKLKEYRRMFDAKETQ